MTEITILPLNGRFKDSFRIAMKHLNYDPPSTGKVDIHLLEVNGSPWLIHPQWEEDRPESPTCLQANAKDLFIRARGDILDRSVDLRARAYWVQEHPCDTTDLRSYSDWAGKQRQRIHKAVLQFKRA